MTLSSLPYLKLEVAGSRIGKLQYRKNIHVRRFREIDRLILKLFNGMNTRIYRPICERNGDIHFFRKEGILATAVILSVAVFQCEACTLVLSTVALLFTQL